jgi:CRP/FNR family transcriptional regulator, anaerobic regulatory protein
MIDAQQFERILQALPILARAEPALLRDFRQTAFMAHIPKGHDVFMEGDHVDAIALLISGVVRVYKIGEQGREITLYRFGNGESCILTANAILNQKTFPAVAVVESEAEAVMIPADTFREWVRRYDLWREFVFELLSERLSSVMTILDEVVFQRMDARIAAFLLTKAKMGSRIQITHQEIAAELGTSREVVSRILEGFASAGLISAARGELEMLDPDGLRARTAM